MPRDSYPFCWQCGGQLTNPFGKPIEGVVRRVDGQEVKLHKVCAIDFDAEHRRLTAQPRDEVPNPERGD